MISLLLLGAGNIGLRHIQSYKSQYKSIDLSIYDPFKSSLELKSLFADCADRIHIVEDVQGIYVNSYDVTLVCTTADVRMLFDYKKITSKIILLEKPIVNSFLEIKKLNHFDRLYVHYPFRAFYKLRHFIESDTGPIKIKVRGQNFAILCNIWHFFDFIYFCKGAHPVSLKLDSKSQLISSKREGFEDLVGKIKIKFNDGSSLELEDTTTIPNNGRNPYADTGETRVDTYQLSDGSEMVYIDGTTSGTTEASRYPYVSELMCETLQDDLPEQYAPLKDVYPQTMWLLAEIRKNFGKDVNFT